MDARRGEQAMADKGRAKADANGCQFLGIRPRAGGKTEVSYADGNWEYNIKCPIADHQSYWVACTRFYSSKTKSGCKECAAITPRHTTKMNIDLWLANRGLRLEAPYTQSRVMCVWICTAANHRFMTNMDNYKKMDRKLAKSGDKVEDRQHPISSYCLHCRVLETARINGFTIKDQFTVNHSAKHEYTWICVTCGAETRCLEENMNKRPSPKCGTKTCKK